MAELLDLSGLKTALNSISLKLESQNDRLLALEKLMPHKVDAVILRDELEQMISKEDHELLKNSMLRVRDTAQENSTMCKHLTATMLTSKDIRQLCTQDDFVRVENTMKQAKEEVLHVHEETVSEFEEVKVIIAEMQRKGNARAAQTEKERDTIRERIARIETDITNLEDETSSMLSQSMSELEKKLTAELERSARIAQDNLTDALVSVRTDIDRLEETYDALTQQNKGAMAQIRGELHTTRAAKATPGARPLGGASPRALGRDLQALQKLMTDLQLEVKNLDESFVTREEWHDSNRAYQDMAYRAYTPQVKDVTVSRTPQATSASQANPERARSISPSRLPGSASVPRSTSFTAISGRDDNDSHTGGLSKSPALNVRGVRPGSAGVVGDHRVGAGVSLERCLSCDQPIEEHSDHGTTGQRVIVDGEEWTSVYTATPSGLIPSSASTLSLTRHADMPSGGMQQARPRPQTAGPVARRPMPAGRTTGGQSLSDKKKKTLDDKRALLVNTRLGAPRDMIAGKDASPTGSGGMKGKLRRGAALDHRASPPNTSPGPASPLPGITSSKAIVSRDKSTPSPQQSAAVMNKNKKGNRASPVPAPAAPISSESLGELAQLSGVGLFTESRTRPT